MPVARYTPATSADPVTLSLLAYLRPERSKRIRDLPTGLGGALPRAHAHGLVAVFLEDPFRPWVRRAALSRAGWRMLRTVRPEAREDWEIDVDLARSAVGARIEAVDGPCGLEVDAVLPRGTRLGIRQRFSRLHEPSFRPSASGEDLMKALDAADARLDLVDRRITRTDDGNYRATLATPRGSVTRSASTQHRATVLALHALARAPRPDEASVFCREKIVPGLRRPAA